MCLIKNNLWKIFVPHQMSSKFYKQILSRDKSLSQFFQIYEIFKVINKYSLRSSLDKRKKKFLKKIWKKTVSISLSKPNISEMYIFMHSGRKLKTLI